jgi:hypothetical protein
MGEKKQDKYLTEMKELPPSYSPDEELKGRGNERKVVEPLEGTPPREDVKLSEVKKQKVSLPEEKPAQSDFENENSDRKLPFSYKDIILGIVNLVSIIFFVIILLNISDKSQELRELKIDELKQSASAGVETSEIEAARPISEAITKYFLNESGVVNFVNDIELQKTEGGAISKVTFAGQNVVADRTGNYGVPMVIELVGSWQTIDTDLQKIDRLPYLFRPVRVDIGYDEENPGVVIYKYGILLYVRESLGKNR